MRPTRKFRKTNIVILPPKIYFIQDSLLVILDRIFKVENMFKIFYLSQ